MCFLKKDFPSLHFLGRGISHKTCAGVVRRASEQVLGCRGRPKAKHAQIKQGANKAQEHQTNIMAQSDLTLFVCLFGCDKIKRPDQGGKPLDLA
jgi:hypothetical protein